MNNKFYNIELDITRECNLTCPACNRLCNLYPKNTKSIMTLDEVKNIIIEINNSNINVGLFKIIGGEPSMHPNLREICEYLNQNLHADKICLKSNSLNGNLSEYIKDTKIKFICDDIRYNIKDIVNSKLRRHVNIYDISSINYNRDYRNCIIKKSCGINIYKFNNIIRYALCSCTSYISRLLQVEEMYTYTSLKQLLDSDEILHYMNICPYCALYNTDFTKKYAAKNVKKSSLVSDCFKNGLEYIKNHPEEYNE